MTVAGAFPFKLEDLQSWTVRRTDGSVVKFTLTTIDVREKAEESKTAETSHVSGAVSRVTHLSGYCSHIPKDPVFWIDAKDRPGVQAPLGLYVGSISSKSVKNQFDFVVDCGNVISTWEMNDRVLEGDDALVALLAPHATATLDTRLLKIDWLDRQAPQLAPAFWPALNKELYGDVMTCCQGGHGRSGTSFVCLLLCNAPDYDALDAIIHLRAVHCPRAIESQVQHEYINAVATYLGRKANAKELGEVHDYKGAFLAMTKPTAVATRKMLGW